MVETWSATQITIAQASSRASGASMASSRRIALVLMVRVWLVRLKTKADFPLFL
jgi:hypothetical protein